MGIAAKMLLYIHWLTVLRRSSGVWGRPEAGFMQKEEEQSVYGDISGSSRAW
jgi:hypothetical protein